MKVMGEGHVMKSCDEGYVRSCDEGYVMFLIISSHL